MLLQDYGLGAGFFSLGACLITAAAAAAAAESMGSVEHYQMPGVLACVLRASILTKALSLVAAGGATVAAVLVV
jgi:hypothetical protein